MVIDINLIINKIKIHCCTLKKKYMRLLVCVKVYSIYLCVNVILTTQLNKKSLINVM